MSPITFIAVGDLHIQESNIHLITQLKSKLLSVVSEKKPDFVILLGDTLHTHQIVHIDAMNCAQDLITELAKFVPVYVIIGNHDLINHQQFLTNRHGFNALKKWNNVIIVDEVVSVEMKKKRILFVPYVPPGSFLKALNTIGQDKWKEANIIFAHQEFKGCLMGAYPSENGDEWSKENPKVISGHIHDAQTLDNGIIYVGTPLQHGFGDTTDKTIGYFEFNKKLHYERIDLKLPRKYTLRIKLPYAPSDEKSLLEKIDVSNDNSYKVVVIGSNEQFVAFRKSVFLKKLETLPIKITFKPNGSKKSLVELPTTLQSDVSNKISFIQILKAFVDESNNKYLKRAFKKVVDI